MVTSTIFERAQKYVTFSNRRRTLSAGQMGQQHISDTLKIEDFKYFNFTAILKGGVYAKDEKNH